MTERQPESKEKVDLRFVESCAGPIENFPVEECTDGDLRAGDIVGGHYKVLVHQGQGGLGDVYKAEHMLLGVDCALKILKSGLNQSSDSLRRFQREAQSVAHLHHPGIVAIREFGMHGGKPFIAMEFVEGIPLSQLLESRGKLEGKQAIDIFTQCAEALGFAHKNHVLHRDIKPANIIVSDDRATIIDFGIAKILDGDDPKAQLTSTGEIFGTPKYMSPEQCQGKETDERSDIYSLGCLAYQMFYGKAPFENGSALELLMKHVSEEPHWYRDAKGLTGLSDILKNCLAKNKNDRYQNCEELLKDLKLIQEGRKPLRKPKEQKSHSLKMVVKSCIALLIVLLGLYLWFIMSFGEGTIQSYSDEIKRNPKSTQAYVGRARLYESKGRYREALNDLNKAVAATPNSYWPYKRRAEVLAKLENFEAAYRDATRAIELDPKRHQNYIARATTLIGLKRYEEAIKDLDHCLNMDKGITLKEWDNRSLIYYYRGAAKNELKRYALARQDFDKALELQPLEPHKNSQEEVNLRALILAERARAWLGSGNMDEALSDCDSALMLEPGYAYVKQLRDYCLKNSSSRSSSKSLSQNQAQ